jgi:hypothetical protein
MADSVPNASTKATSNLVSALSGSGVVILAVAAMLIIVLVVIYIVSMVKKNKLQNVVLHPNVIALDNRDAVPVKIPEANMSLVEVGQEFSYSFWLYLSELYDATSNYKLIMQRGNTTDLVSNGRFVNTANPIVFMDKLTNKMYIAMSTTRVKDNNISFDQILSQDGEKRYNSGYLISTIDYVPLQRWVNITVVVKENTLYIYMDGDMYSAANVSDMAGVTSTGPRPIIRGTSGGMTIGDKKNTSNGYVSRSRYFNYALTQREVAGIYKEGPSKRTLLSYLGINNYGVRSPVYEIK